MKGVIFNLLEEVVTDELGEELWCDMLDMADLPGSYTSLGNYPDTEMLSLVACASKLTSLSEREVLRWFGKHALGRLAARYPNLVEGQSNALELLLSVNSMIHPEVRKLYPGAICPHFRFQKAEQETTLVGYRSPRQLCSLVEGFIEGVAAHFQTKVKVTHQSCTHDGARECQLAVQWAS